MGETKLKLVFFEGPGRSFKFQTPPNHRVLYLVYILKRGIDISGVWASSLDPASGSQRAVCSPGFASQQGSGSAVGPLLTDWSVSLIASLLPDVVNQHELHHIQCHGRGHVITL